MIHKYTGFVLMIIMVACSSKEKSFWEQNDEDLKIQLMAMYKNADESSLKDYRLRIYPGKRLLNIASTESYSAMWYKMDSCIYMLKGDQKVYPKAVEPISNGLKNSFEYLILFESDDIEKANVKLVYKDKHLNKRTYFFSLTEK